MLEIFLALVALGVGLFIVWNVIIPLIVVICAVVIGGIASLFSK